MQLRSTTLFLFVTLLLTINSCRKEQIDEPVNELSFTDEKRSCVTMDNLDAELLRDPGLKTRMEEMEQAIQRKMSSRAGNSITATIPVVVHILYNTPAQNISDAQVYSQIDVLNRDFSRTNADAGNTPSVFQQYAGSTGIQFALAQRDPNGNPTTGIIRKFCTNSSWSSNGAVKLSSLGGDDAWPCTNYLNIWVCNLNGALGYATFPGGNPIADGVVIRTTAFGNTGYLQAPYNLGRTATHEVGHWLYLFHIWGDAQCGNDMINDSPTQQAANYGCPAFPHVTCNNGAHGDMFMNYMDYTNDACMNMFTQGQIARMEATLQATRSTILTSLGAVPPAGAPCNAPTGLSASSITENSAIFSWTASGATSYNVRYKTTTSNTWTNAISTGTSFSASSLASATAYEFQVQGVCPGNTSPFSASTPFTTLAPAGCDAPSNLHTTSIQNTNATISWTVTQAGSYNVMYKPSASATWNNISTPNNYLNLTALTPGTYYDYQVQGVCSSGNSDWSQVGGFVTTSPPVLCPTPNAISCVFITTSGASISWGLTPAGMYNIRYRLLSNNNWQTASTAGNDYILSGLAAGTQYQFQVQGVCGTDPSLWSAPYNFTTLGQGIGCDVPTGLTTSSVTSSSANVTWGNTGASSYDIRYRVNGTTAWQRTSSPIVGATLSGLAGATTYECQVKSTCSATSSPFSTSIYFTTP